MASNPHVNHVELADGTMLMDIRDTTADAESVENGRVFYSASGARTIGAMPVKLDQVAAYVEYSDSGTYSVGDIRTHGGRIYRCNTTIAEAEEWNSAHWTEVTLSELLFGKADKVSGATSGHVATLDGNGNLVDSGKTLGVSVPANAVFTDTTYTFTDNNPTLAWGTKSKIATIGGVDIHVTMPANPNTDHYDWSDITNKPASYPGGCTGAAGSVAWANVTGKPNDYPGGCTGNAASATKWQTARSLWGNSVDGTADVNGTLLSPNGIKTGSRASGSKGSGVEIGNDGGIEIFHSSTPFIDFHYQASTSDYSVRLICNSATNLSCTGTISAQGFTGNVTGNCSGSAGSVAWANVTGKPSTYPPESHTHSYLPLAGGNMTGKIYSGAARMLQWTTSDSDNNDDGASWYGLGKFTPSGDYAWVCLSNYWGLSFRARDSDHVKINGNVVLNAGNYTSYVPKVWMGNVKFTNGVADMSSTIGSGKKIYSVTLNDEAMGNQRYFFSCGGTKIAGMSLVNYGSGYNLVSIGSATLGLCIVYK